MSDYGGFRAIVEEAREIEREERAHQLVDCPLCGEPLDENSRGELNCPLGHFRVAGGTPRGP